MFVMKRLGAAALCGAMVWAGTAGAAVTSTPRYLCERDVEIPAVYVSAAGEPGVVVLLIEGRMINLEATNAAASGVRYRFPNDGSGYVWWTHQGAAQLIWYDAVENTETTVYALCSES